MAERSEMSFKNKELKMWLIIIIPVMIIGGIALFAGEPYSRYIPFFTLLFGLVLYYSWRYRYRKKKKENKELS
ncbi:hypothetical protein DHX103_10810 [Planococcus sp. X10-3]|uniref:hypothetical protein n=1 Tax=Planococcus sp. X10-3 TaxID=3061240 RepID=UPI003BB21D57